MDRNFSLFKAGLTVLDLAASPGGWSQYACSRVGGEGQEFAVDILEMKSITGVRFLKLDLSAADTVERVTDWMGDRKANVVVSDMAPNSTGNSTIDAQNYSRLYTAIFVICGKILADSGSLVFKYFF